MHRYNKKATAAMPFLQSWAGTTKKNTSELPLMMLFLKGNDVLWISPKLL